MFILVSCNLRFLKISTTINQNLYFFVALNASTLLKQPFISNIIFLGIILIFII